MTDTVDTKATTEKMTDTITTNMDEDTAMEMMKENVPPPTVAESSDKLRDEDVEMEEVESKEEISDGSVDTMVTTSTTPKLKEEHESNDGPSPMDEDDEAPESATTDTVMKAETEGTAQMDTDEPGKPTKEEQQPPAEDENDDAYDGPTIDLSSLMNVEDLSADQKKLMENRLGALQEDYKESVQRQRELRIQEIKNGFKFNVNVNVTDEEATFCYDFCKKHQYDPMDKIEDEGVFFLQQLREMLNERRKMRAQGYDKKEKRQRRKKRRRQQRAAASGGAPLDESGSEWEAFSSDDFDDSDDSDYCDSDGDDLLGTPSGDEAVGDVDNSWTADVVERKKRRAARRRAANAKKGHKINGEKRCGRLLLDDAMKDVNSKEGWSEARIKAYEQRESNPNSYYYRFNDPGENQGHGEWSKKDQKLFMERLMERGANVQWGVFSMTIPGRVGYQCSNYYRALITSKQVTDPNYSFAGGKLNFRRGALMDKSGNKLSKHQNELYKQFAFTVNKDATGVWTNLPARHPKCPKWILSLESNDGDEGDDEKERSGVEDAESPKKSSKKSRGGKKKGKKRRKKSDDDEDEANAPARKRRRTESKKSGGESKTTGGKKRRKKTKEEIADPNFSSAVDVVSNVDANNPLPEMIDTITNLPVVQPAISPYGHVLGYDTWCKILRQGCKNTCPFTKQRLTRRQLTKLTHENIDEHKDKIVNVTAEELAGLQIGS